MEDKEKLHGLLPGLDILIAVERDRTHERSNKTEGEIRKQTKSEDEEDDEKEKIEGK